MYFRVRPLGDFEYLRGGGEEGEIVVGRGGSIGPVMLDGQGVRGRFMACNFSNFTVLF